MKPQYSHDVVTSALLWLDNRLANKGQAYQNITGSLYRQNETGVQGITYVSPYRSWVYDSCVQGANIPSGFYNNSGQFLTRASGLVFDFINGRVISPQNWGPLLSGQYARKEVNVYFSSAEENSYVLETILNENPNLKYPLTGFQGRALAAPLIMLTNAREFNEPWSLGGYRSSENTIRGLVISNTNYLQEGINSLCRDAAQTYIPLASYADAPIGGSGDLKGVDYNYCTGIYDYYGCDNGLWIETVYVGKINDRSNNNTTYYLSTIDFDVSKPRIPSV